MFSYIAFAYGALMTGSAGMAILKWLFLFALLLLSINSVTVDDITPDD